jgi:hypothetical protein
MPGVLKKALVSFAVQRALWRSAACLLRGVLGAALILVVTCAFDRFVDVSGYWRLPATLAFGLTLAGMAARVLFYLFRPENYDEVAQTLDEVRSDRRGYLRSLLDFTRRGVHRHFLAEISRDRAIGIWQGEGVGRFIVKKGVAYLGLGVIVLAVALGAVARVEAVRAGLLARRFLTPLGNHMRPTATWVEVEADPETSVNGGDTVTIRARVRGRPVSAPTLLARLSKASGAQGVQKLQPESGGIWQLKLNDVRESFTYAVTLGKARTAVFGVHVVPRPTIVGVTVDYDYPKYTGLKKKTESLNGRTITALEGTKIKLDATCNIPLQQAMAVTAEGKSLFVIGPKDPATAFLRLFVSRHERIDVVLLGQNGLSSVDEPPFNIRVLIDSPPAVIITGKLDERAYYENEVVEIGYRAQDDIGITEIGLQAGRIEQAADLPEFGARQTQGMIKVPVSTLAPNGESTVKLKVVARDGKGQAGASRELTLRVAVNSYDRQLRLVRNALTGQFAFNTPSQLGFPQLQRHEDRLQLLRGFGGTLTMLNEMLGDRVKPGAAHDRQVSSLRYAAQRLSSGFDHVSAGYGRAFDWIAGGVLTPRLKDIVGLAVCDSELSLPTDLLAGPLSKALASDNPKAALAGLGVLAAGAVPLEEQVVDRLRGAQRVVQTELAGYLAGGLVLNLARATPASWKDTEFITSEHARLEELDDVVRLGLVNELGTNTADELHAAVTNREAGAGLEQAAVLLPDLSGRLVTMAAALAATNAAPVPFAAWHVPAGPAGDPNRVGILAFKLMAMARQERGDPVVLLRDSLSWLSLYSGAGTVVVGASPAQEAGWRLYAAYSQARVDAEALRVGVAAGFLSPGDPEFEFYWLRLRESVLAIRRLAASPELPAPLKNGLPSLVESLKPALNWMPQERDPARLVSLLRGWEADFQGRLLTPLPAAREWLTAADQALANAWPLCQAAVAAYRTEIKGVISAGRYVQAVMPMYASLQALQGAVTTAANKAELARLHRVGGKVDVERLVLAQILLTRAANHFDELILRDMENTSNLPNAGGMRGKQGQYEELDRILADVELIFRAAPDEATRQRVLHDNRIGPAWLQETAFMKVARHSADSATNIAETLSAIAGDRVSAAALWGELWCRSRFVLDEIEAGRGPAAQGLARIVEAALEPLKSMPKDVQPLPEILGDLKQKPAELKAGSRYARDLAGVLEEMKPLARPVMPGARNVFPREALAVSRARVAPAFRQVAAQAALDWTVSELEMNRRIRTIQQPRLSFGGMGFLSEDEFANLKLPKYLYLELKRAREQAMPALFKDRCYRYLNGIMEAAR